MSARGAEKMKAMFTTLLLVAAAGASQAATPATHILKLDEVRTQQQEIHDGVMAGTGRYKGLSNDVKMELLTRQTRLLNIIGDKTSPYDLTEEQRLEAFNILEWEEATINNAPSEALVCTRTQVTGSHFAKQVCKTRAQSDADNAEARRVLEENPRGSRL